MKKLSIITLLITFFLVLPVQAQSAESIWISANLIDFKTGETVIATVNGTSATPIQGMTFQIRYDPACLQALNAASPIPGMNGLLLPQAAGLVDASFASTTPVVVNGILAEIRFTTLGACQTNLTLESAALVIKNESGFAAPLPGVTIGAKTIPLAVSAEQGSPNDTPLLGTPLPLEVAPNGSSPLWLSTGTVIVLAMVGVLLLVGVFVLFRILR